MRFPRLNKGQMAKGSRRSAGGNAFPRPRSSMPLLVIDQHVQEGKGLEGGNLFQFVHPLGIFSHRRYPLRSEANP